MITDWKFKTHNNYPGRIICNDGSVYNEKSGKKMKLKPSRGNYLRIRFCKDGKEYYKWAHRAVAECFIGCVLNMEVHHVDRNTRNNHDVNLQIKTKQENLDLRVYDKYPLATAPF